MKFLDQVGSNLEYKENGKICVVLNYIAREDQIEKV